MFRLERERKAAGRRRLLPAAIKSEEDTGHHVARNRQHVARLVKEGRMTADGILALGPYAPGTHGGED